jgi:subtilisin family serine protease
MGVTRTYHRVLAGCAAVAVSLLVGSHAHGVASTPQPAASERLVIHVDRSHQADVLASSRAMGLHLANAVGDTGWFTFEVPAGRSGRAVTRELSRLDGVSTVAPDVKMHALVAPNDPLYSSQWGLHNTGQSGGTPGADIGVEQAWDVSTGSREVVVAVVDSGVQITHPDLAGNIWRNPGEIPGNNIDDDNNGFVDDVNGWDFVDGDNTVASGTSGDAHATHVSGIIGAVGGNGIGVTGVNQRVSIMVCRFIVSERGNASDAAAGIVYAVDQGADVINCSFGAPTYSEALDAAIRYAASRGVLVVIAAGNESQSISSSNPMWPASTTATNAVVVAATTNTDALATFSNRGPDVDIAAPGVAIASTVPDNAYQNMQGTSMATPMVVGALALLKSMDPELGAADLYGLVEDAVDPVPALSGLVRLGGRLDVGAAAALVAARPTITAPAADQLFAAGAPMGVAWTPAASALPSDGYQVQVGTAAETLGNAGFESGSLAGFSASGTAGFVCTSDLSLVRTGTYAARAAYVASGQRSGIGLNVSASAERELGFWYRFAPGDPGVDTARVWIDGVATDLPATGTGWAERRFQLAPGDHAIAWAYDEGGTARGSFALDGVSVCSLSWAGVSLASPSATSVECAAPGGLPHAAVRVRSVRGTRYSPWSRRDIRTSPDLIAPAAPTGLSATSIGATKVSLHWTDAPSDVATTRVVRSLDATPTNPWDGLVVASTTGGAATDVGLLPGQTPRYAVFTLDSAGNVSDGATARVTIPVGVAPSAPTGMSAVRVGDDIGVQWTESTDGSLDRTRVLKRAGTPPTGPWDPAATLLFDGRGTSVVDTSAAVGVEATLYYRAYSANDSMDFSAPASASLFVDTLAPTGTFTLENGAAFAYSTTVSVQSHVAGATEMRFDDGAGFGAWRSFASASTLVLSGYGSKTVRAEYRDAAGNTLALQTYIYVHDLSLPPGPVPTSTPVPTPTVVVPQGTLSLASGAEWTTTRTVSVDSSVSGAAEMRVDAGEGFGPWQPFAAHTTATMSAWDGNRRIRVEYRSSTGHTLALERWILLDTTPPSRPATPTASASTTAAVSVAWAAVPGSSAVCVWRRSASPTSTFELIARCGAGTTRYLDPKRPAGLWAYRLTAVDEHGLESAQSAVASVTVTHPSTLVLSQTRTGLARVSLRDPLGGVLGYKTVKLQEWTGKSWKTVATLKTSAQGVATARLKLGSTRLVRAVFTAQSYHRAATSKSLRFKK